MEDADIGKAVKLAAETRLANSGQVCINAKRFIVHENRYQEFVDKLRIELQENWKYGDQLMEETKMGPLARRDLVETLEKQIQEAYVQGATVSFGGKRIDSNTNANLSGITVVENFDNKNII